jgi:hypothetical protein
LIQLQHDIGQHSCTSALEEGELEDPTRIIKTTPSQSPGNALVPSYQSPSERRANNQPSPSSTRTLLGFPGRERNLSSFQTSFKKRNEEEENFISFLHQYIDVKLIKK